MITRARPQGWQLAECLLPGLTLSFAEELTQRVSAEAAGRPDAGVSFLGSLVMPGDEVLLCVFSGAQEDVRAVSERARPPLRANSRLRRDQLADDGREPQERPERTVMIARGMTMLNKGNASGQRSLLTQAMGAATLAMMLAACSATSAP